MYVFAIYHYPYQGPLRALCLTHISTLYGSVVLPHSRSMNCYFVMGTSKSNQWLLAPGFKGHPILQWEPAMVALNGGCDISYAVSISRYTTITGELGISVSAEAPIG